MRPAEVRGARGSLHPGLVVVVRPDVDAVRRAPDQVQQLDGVRHVVEHTARQAEVEPLIRLPQVLDEVPQQETHRGEPGHFLHHQALQEAALVALDRDHLARAALLEHVAVARLQRPEFDHALVTHPAQPLERPCDARVGEQRHLASLQSGQRRRRGRDPFALEGVQRVLRRRGGGDQGGLDLRMGSRPEAEDLAGLPDGGSQHGRSLSHLTGPAGALMGCSAPRPRTAATWCRGDPPRLAGRPARGPAAGA